MATKKELEARIAALEARLDALNAQQPAIVVPLPRDSYPYGWPKITCGQTIAPAGGGHQFTINSSAALPGHSNEGT